MQKLGLVFVAVYQSALKLMYVDKLLERVRSLFVDQYKPNKYEYVTFDGVFKKELEKAEKAAANRPTAMANGHDTLTQRKASAYFSCLVLC